ncbi:spherulin 4-like cell surface [Grosmannia clavigera kw1407]|uniref:Spherulin 4-like cell surface n=1 Tax=Grosmannia clavigera (strain kw1407 / UAMH 11150) TaxID=655863 RepID=F0XBL1_GROCL|nr:spherulin 4-like cell surface [Grosmannia clavigera kw1407]EFX04914.1 spherulin 4-like cell surface [Grosmannia clavigera kw1407]
MNLEKHLPQKWRHSKWLWILLAIIAIIIIIVIVVPLAVLLPRNNRHHKHLSTSVLLPLYIYPTNSSTWSPLYEALTNNPVLNFTIVINPKSGPGSGNIPDDNYVAGVKRLNSFANVRTVGYVRTGYASRNISDVVDEVNIYSGWYTNNSDIAMHGIFFDEAPHQYTADAVDFMVTADAAVKNATGLRGSKTIIHNPGTVPDAEFNVTSPDITVIFEDDFSAWSVKETTVKALYETYSTRSAYSIMVNSLPVMGNNTLSGLLSTLSRFAEHLFVTDLTADYYEAFSDDWLQFTEQMPLGTN